MVSPPPQGPDFFGCDLNSDSIEWVSAHLPHVRVCANGLNPPLPFEGAFFDLCYSVSVFTHLPDALQRPWIEELHRVVRRGGVLMLTLSGEGDFVRLTPAEQNEFEQGRLVVVDAKHPGSNLCGVYHPEEYVRQEWSDLFRLLRRYPQGAAGSPYQDLYVFERI